LTGRVLVQGDELNVQVDLNSVVDESQFWGKQYDFRITNESSALREISNDVLAQLELKLMREDQKRVISCCPSNSETSEPNWNSS